MRRSTGVAGLTALTHQEGAAPFDGISDGFVVNVRGSVEPFTTEADFLRNAGVPEDLLVVARLSRVNFVATARYEFRLVSGVLQVRLVSKNVRTSSSPCGPSLESECVGVPPFRVCFPVPGFNVCADDVVKGQVEDQLEGIATRASNSAAAKQTIEVPNPFNDDEPFLCDVVADCEEAAIRLEQGVRFSQELAPELKDQVVATTTLDSGNWRCISDKTRLGGTVDLEPATCRFVPRASRLNVYPDAIELVWFDGSFESPASITSGLAAAVVAPEEACEPSEPTGTRRRFATVSD